GVQIIHAQTTLDGGAHFSDGYTMVDGFGTTVASFAPADPAARDGGQWIVMGLPDRDSLGRVTRSYQPGFFTGDPIGYPLGGSPSATYAAVNYDEWGRVHQSFALDGSEVSRTNYHALSLDTWNERQLGLGLPPTTVYKDGFGRLTRAERRLSNNDKDMLRI